MRASFILAGALLLGACDGGGLTGSGGGSAIDAQVAHPSGAVVQVVSARVDGARTAVDLKVMNGTNREIRLNQGRERSFILTDGAEKRMLIAPSGNPNLSVPAGQSADLTLVFEGTLPRSGTATLMLNESGSDSEHGSAPRIQIALPMDRAGSGDVPEASAMSNLRPNAASNLRQASGQGSTLGAGGSGASSLQAVDALKSELGAVETERGTVVSLPGDVTFDFDKATIQADAKPTLDRLVELIQASSEGDISVEGHTDSRGDDGYNQKLSLSRAEAVKAYLVSKGVSEGRLRTLGLGEARPIAPNANADGSDDEAGRQRNRRVEVVLPGAARAEQ